jgi:predicted RNA-binding protein (virulence factor B family)
MNQKPPYEPGQLVQLQILRETDLGFVAKINDQDEGLLYHSEIFENLEIDQRLPGYIRQIRPDGKIDLILQAIGNFGVDEISQRILKALDEAQGFLPITDHSEPKLIYDLFGVSKKKFKIALGHLYKKRWILISDKGIKRAQKGSK